MESEERAILASFVGQTLVSFDQEEPEERRNEGDWQDDPPLALTFSDGRILEITAGGWHQSGALYIRSYGVDDG